MPPSLAPEGSAKARFAALLEQHLKGGTRPPGQRGLGKWTHAKFAGEIGIGTRTVDNYCNGSTVPPDLSNILKALFGDYPSSERAQLAQAYDEAMGVEPLPIPFSGVPRLTPYFTGRQSEVATLVETLLLSGRPTAVLVQGSPGIGKTTLTHAVAVDPAIIDRFGAARWFIPLETVRSADQMRDAIVRALGCDPSAGFAAALDALAGRQGLLILDNLETPWDPKDQRQRTEETLGDLAAVPGLALLASFRGRDLVRGPEWALIHPVEKLGPEPSTELFCRAAHRSFPGDPFLPKFIVALDGVPLAIELVAHRAFGDTPLAALWDRWIKIGARLAVRPDDDLSRLTSLPHSIELSLESSRLTLSAHRLFRLLARLPAGLAGQDRDRLLNDEGFDADDALRRIGLATERDGRLDLLSPIRDYVAAAPHLAPEAGDDGAWPEHYLGLAESFGEVIGTEGGEGALRRLLPELANIESAFLAMLNVNRRDRAMAALWGFSTFAYFALAPTPVFGQLAASCRAEGDVQGEANCIQGLGDIALARSEYDEARKAYEAALPLLKQAGNVQGEANCIKGLGDIALARSEYDEARKAYGAALILYKRARSMQGEANCIRGLGDIALVRSEYDEARKAYEAAQPLYQGAADVVGEANCIYGLGDIALARSEYDEARRAYEAALPLCKLAGDRQGEANCILRLGDIALARSEYDQALKSYEAALSLYKRAGDVQGEANCIPRLGDIALARSEYDEARKAYEAALSLYKRAGDVQGEANCIQGLGDIALARSEYDEARKAYEAALPLYKRSGDVQGEANCMRKLASLPQAIVTPA